MAPRKIKFQGRISEETHDIARSTLNNMEKVFRRNNKKLRIYDDRFIYAYLNAFGYSYVEGSACRSIDFMAEFICPDPFWYNDATGSDSRILNASDTAIDITNSIYRESFTITNDGTAFVYPVFTITASGSITQVIVRNTTTGRTLTYTGTIAAGKVLVIDCGNFRVTNDGVEDLTNFSGSFLWLDPGANAMQYEGKITAQYDATWSPRNF